MSRSYGSVSVTFSSMKCYDARKGHAAAPKDCAQSPRVPLNNFCLRTMSASCSSWFAVNRGRLSYGPVQESVCCSSQSALDRLSYSCTGPLRDCPSRSEVKSHPLERTKVNGRSIKVDSFGIGIFDATACGDPYELYTLLFCQLLVIDS
jgi:hypothetical protein